MQVVRLQDENIQQGFERHFVFESIRKRQETISIWAPTESIIWRKCNRQLFSPFL